MKLGHGLLLPCAAERTHAADVATRGPNSGRLRFPNAPAGRAVSAHPPRS